MDLSSLSSAELKDLLDQIPAEIKRREKKEKVDVLKAIESLAAERGFKLEELLDTATVKKERSPVPVKYRHPENAALSWTGRGRQPKWIVEFVNAGGKLENLSV